MTFDEYLIKKGYKQGQRIPAADASELYKSWNRFSDQLLLKQEEEQPAQAEPQELAQNISSLLQAGDAANIAFNPAVIQQAQKAIMESDTDEMQSIYSNLSGRFEARIKEQTEEEKELKNLEDGSQILVGKNTGTRYTTSGQPISPTSMNTTTYNMSVLNSGVPQEQIGSMVIPTATTATFDPEVYKKQILDTGRPQMYQTPQEEVQAETFAKYNDFIFEEIGNARQSSSDLPKVNQAIDLLNKIKTGTFQQELLGVRRLFGQDVSDQETFQSNVGELAMRFLAMTKGAISDREMAYFTGELSPNLGKSNEGNRKLLEFLKAQSIKQQEMAREAMELQKKGVNPMDIYMRMEEIRNKDVYLGESGNRAIQMIESSSLTPKQKSEIQGILSGEE